VPPLFLLNGQLFFIFLFNTFKFVTCHSSNAVYIVIVGWEVAILVLTVLLPTGFRLAPTSADLLKLTFLLFQQLAERRYFPLDDLVLSKHTIQ
jgi:hypothetical protein